MERFLKFKEDVDLADLQRAQSDPHIIVLRKSQATNTVQIKVPEGMSAKKIKQAFGSFQVEKIYNEFPYPIKYDGLSKYFILPFVKLFQKIT
jgi:hypothetical protein